MAAIENILTDDDLNGECFIIDSQIEIEKDTLVYTVVFAPDRPVAWIEGKSLSDVPDALRKECSLWLHYCMFANIQDMKAHTVVLPESIIARIAYYRVLAICKGFISYGDGPTEHNCRYSLRRMLPDTWNPPDDASATARILLTLSDTDQAQMKKNFLNAVCTVAYVFRIRGVHWAENIEITYRDMWKKVLRQIIRRLHF